MSAPTISGILAPGYADGLATKALVEIRNLRDAANEVETGLSYLRRVVQGRLDIVTADLRRREEGQPAVGLSTLVERLPQILSDRIPAPGLGRLSTIVAPGEVDAEIEARIEDTATTDALTHLSDLSDSEVATIATGLEAIEREISAQRRSIHEVVDRLQEEVVRRYKTGEASVDNLLA